MIGELVDVTVIVRNDLTRDSRVQKQVRGLRDKGFQVSVIARSGDTSSNSDAITSEEPIVYLAGYSPQRPFSRLSPRQLFTFSMALALPSRWTIRWLISAIGERTGE